MKQVCVVGSAGFIGSHLCARLEDDGNQVVGYDLINGQDARDIEQLTQAMRGCDTVVHLASNADIAAAAESPTIDFDNGTVITQSVLEAARINAVRTVIYASGSGVYGDRGLDECKEDDELEPISPYGASKLAGEALLSAYGHMFFIRGIALRFANVVGSGQTHGVGLDFMQRLKEDPTRLTMMGDGRQTKSYIHVNDVVEAILTVERQVRGPFHAFNVATHDALTVDEIAEMASKVLGVTPTIWRQDGDRGWSGDVPVVYLNSDRIRRLGWENSMTSRLAMRCALESMA